VATVAGAGAVGVPPALVAGSLDPPQPAARAAPISIVDVVPTSRRESSVDIPFASVTVGRA
jgi:hypothetical protein